MAEELIAEYRWRRRLRDWSNVCDNHLVLDRTTSLDDGPGALNQFGICGPPCDMCVTPFGALIPLKCDMRQANEKLFISLPPKPEVLKIPLPLSVSVVGGSFTAKGQINRATCTIPNAAPLANLLSRSQTQTFGLAGNEDNGFFSAWSPFGSSIIRMNWSWNEQLIAGGHVNSWTRSISLTQQWEIRMQAQPCPAAVAMSYRVKAGSAMYGDTGFIPSPNNHPVHPFDFANGRDQFNSIDAAVAFYMPNATHHSTYQGWVKTPDPQFLQLMNELPNYKGVWDPFVLYGGLIGCGLHPLYKQVVRDVNYPLYTGGSANAIRVATETSDPLKHYAYMLKLTGGR